MKVILPIALALLWSFGTSVGAPIDYSRDVLPILSDKCYHCHGPDEKGRKAKLRLDTREGAFAKRKSGTAVIIPGRPSDSELVQRITATNADDKMPPAESNRTLTEKQIQTLTQWISEGATWGAHWAFVPPVRPQITNNHGENAIDLLVRARLAKEKLVPAPRATRETLLRRVTLDLTGLPPTVGEINAFLADSSTNAYEKIVDRLLASPRYGERMASEWLDLARYADTHGYQMDRFRPMWPYRDWVIKAFNANLPYDQFVTWQLAGDLLPNATKEQRLATAFNRLHNQNEEGGIVEEEYRVAYVVDRVNTFGTAFLGLTTECTRCHDHKYDPLTQRDFYSLFAFFQNIDEAGQTSYFTDSMPVPTLLLTTADQDAQMAALKRQIAAKEKELREHHAEAAGEFESWLVTHTNTPVQGMIGNFAFDEIISNKVANLTNPALPAKAHENPKLIEGRNGKAAQLTGENGFAIPGFGHFSRSDPFTLSLWLRAASHAPRQVVLHHSKAPVDAGSRGYELLLENGRVAFGLHHMWPRNSLKVTSKLPVPTNEWVHVTATYDGSSRASGVKLFINGFIVEHEIIRDGLFKDITYGGGEPDFAIGNRFRDNGFKDGAVDDLKMFNRALTRLEVAEVAGIKVPQTGADAKLTQAERDLLFEYFVANVHAPSIECSKDLQRVRSELAKLINPIPEAMVMEEMAQPKPAHILKRGAYDAPGDVVTADTPKVLPPMPADAPRNRLGLAQWLLQKNHPLMARVTANRAWQTMFGLGIVETSDNFGSQGAQPTNQELLDWLACEFVEPTVDRRMQPWDLKGLLKLIAMSETYQQSSKATPDLLARDARNELLARGPSRRLKAEMLRDQALCLSGLLVEKIGGPSVKPYQPAGIWDIAMGKPHYDQGRGEDLYRRSLYTYWKRTVPPPSMVTFDAADRSYCTVRRQSTSTPLQALALLNDVQLVEAARLLGEKMLKQGGEELEQQITWLMKTAAGRPPTSKELRILSVLYTEQLELFSTDETAAKKLRNVGEKPSDSALKAERVAAATVLAQAILNDDSVVWER